MCSSDTRELFALETEVAALRQRLVLIDQLFKPGSYIYVDSPVVIPHHAQVYLSTKLEYL